jgi:Tfp pilus assembly protein PilV
MRGAPRAPRPPGRAPPPSSGAMRVPPPHEPEFSAARFWRTVGHHSLALLMEALYQLGVIFLVAVALCTPPLVFLSLWNWVRTRRLALFLLGLLAIDIACEVATAGRSGIHWPVPAIIATMGLAMLLTCLWPRWRLLRNPLPKSVPPRMPVARGVLDSRPWPSKNAHGVTTVSVLIAFVMVFVVAGAAVSCLARAAQASRGAQRLFVATTLLEAEFERVRAGAITTAEVEQDLSLRASRLLPNASGRATLKHRGAADLVQLNLEVTWQETSRPRRTAALAGLVYTGG